MEHVVNKKTHEVSCGRGIGPSKRLHSNNTQHSQERCQFESTAPVNKQQMTDALNRAATIIGVDELTIHMLQVSRFMCRYFRWVVL